MREEVKYYYTYTQKLKKGVYLRYYCTKWAKIMCANMFHYMLWVPFLTLRCLFTICLQATLKFACNHSWVAISNLSFLQLKIKNNHLFSEWKLHEVDYPMEECPISCGKWYWMCTCANESFVLSIIPILYSPYKNILLRPFWLFTFGLGTKIKIGEKIEQI